jgi:hypothetical protein
VQRERAGEPHQRLRLVTLGERLERRVQADPVGLGEGERPAAVKDELHTRLRRDQRGLAPRSSGRSCRSFCSGG